MKNEKIKSVLNFINYKVNEVRFKENKGFNEKEEDIEINFDVNADYEKIDNNSLLVTLILEVFKDSEENNYPFSMYVELTGFFKICEDIDPEIKDFIEKKNTVAILFPYARAIVSTYTASANIPPLILPPINVNNMIDNN